MTVASEVYQKKVLLELAKPDIETVEGKGLSPDVVDKWKTAGSKLKLYLSALHSGAFTLSDKIDHNTALVYAANVTGINTERLSMAHLEFSLLSASRTKAFTCITLTEIDGYIAHVRSKLRMSGVQIEDEALFKEAATDAARFSCGEHLGLALEDTRRLASFYLHLGLCLQNEGFKATDSPEDTQSLIANGEKLNAIIFEILNLCPFSAEESEAVEFKEKNVILMCFKVYTQYTKSCNKSYLANNIHLISELKDMYNYRVAVLRKQEIEPEQEAKFEAFENFTFWFPVILETYLLAYNIEHTVRECSEMKILMDRCRALSALFPDIFEILESCMGVELSPDHPISKLLSNVVDEIEAEKLKLKAFLLMAETEYNKCVEDIVFFSDLVSKMYSQEEFMAHFTNLVAALQRVQYRLLYSFTASLKTVPLSTLGKFHDKEQVPELNNVEDEENDLVKKLARNKIQFQ